MADRDDSETKLPVDFETTGSLSDNFGDDFWIF